MVVFFAARVFHKRRICHLPHCTVILGDMSDFSIETRVVVQDNTLMPTRLTKYMGSCPTPKTAGFGVQKGATESASLESFT